MSHQSCHGVRTRGLLIALIGLIAASVVAGEALANADAAAPLPLLTRLGPDGADISAVVASRTDASLMFAGIGEYASGYGIYRSNDAGRTWQGVFGIGTYYVPRIFDLVALDDGTILVATHEGLFRTTDGIDWSQVPLPIDDIFDLVDLHVDEGTSPPGLWVAIGQANRSPYPEPSAKLLNSKDAGATWQDRTPPTLPRSARDLRIGAQANGPALAVIRRDESGDSLWVSPDDGVTWLERSRHLAYRYAAMFVGARLLVSEDVPFGSSSLAVSEDLGIEWTQAVMPASTPPLVHFALSPDDHDTVYGASQGDGLAVSADGGLTWDTGIGGSDGLVVKHVEFPRNSAAAYLAVYGTGVYRSVERGAALHFAQSAVGFRTANVMSADANPQRPTELAALLGIRLFTSRDDGRTWQPEWPVQGPHSPRVVRFSPSGDLHVVEWRRLWVRNANGLWSDITPQAPAGTWIEAFETIAFHPLDPHKMLLTGYDDEGVVVYRSEDAGQHWSVSTRIPSESPTVKNLALADDGTAMLLVGPWADNVESTSGLFHSPDAGVTWNEVELPEPTSLRYANMCIGEGNGVNTVVLGIRPNYWAAPTRWYRSTDAGHSWSQPSLSPMLTSAVACRPHGQGAFYALRNTESPGIDYSPDAGFSFAALVAPACNNYWSLFNDISVVNSRPTQRLLLGSACGVLGTPLPMDIFVDSFDGR